MAAPRRVCSLLTRLLCARMGAWYSVMQESGADKGLKQLAALIAEGKVKVHLDRCGRRRVYARCQPHRQPVRRVTVPLRCAVPRQRCAFSWERLCRAAAEPPRHGHALLVRAGCGRWRRWRQRTNMQSRATCGGKWASRSRSWRGEASGQLSCWRSSSSSGGVDHWTADLGCPAVNATQTLGVFCILLPFPRLLSSLGLDFCQILRPRRSEALTGRGGGPLQPWTLQLPPFCFASNCQ